MKNDSQDSAPALAMLPRRRFVGATLTALAWPASAWAAALLPTPQQSAGPYYPLQKPSDQDADLAWVTGRTQPADGLMIRIFGNVFGSDGFPIEGAQIEIWQANALGRYSHPGDTSSAPLDPNFQGFGRLSTDAEGRYQFRTIKPAPYGSRTPHVHFRVSGRRISTLTTQMYFAGEAANERDSLLRQIRGDRLRKRIVINFVHIPQIPSSELAGWFDIIVERS